MDSAAREPMNAMPSATAETCFTHRSWFLVFVLVIVTFIAYQPTWHAGFIWDDDDHLTANPAMTAPHGLRMIWSSLTVSRYYPLTLTSFWVQWRLWGLNPRPYHLVNVALHAANAVLVFVLLRRLGVRAAWLGAAIWALHPVNVESVAWITELKNTQSGLFFFLAVLCFLRFERSARRGWYGLSLVCGLAAMTSKPSTVVLPLALLLCVWWERRSWRWTDILRVAPFFVLALGMSALTVAEQLGPIQTVGTAQWNLGLARRFVLAGKAVWFYAFKVLWPVSLTFVYPRWELNAATVLNWLPVGGIVIGGVVLWICWRQSWVRAVLFGGGFFVLLLLPVLGFFDVFYFRYSYVADHFQYLACLGLISVAASAGTVICERAGQQGRRFGALAGMILLLLLGVATWRQAQIYRDVATLWGDTLMKDPRSWMAHNNLGSVLFEQGKIDDALGHFKQAALFKPDFAETHNNLGLALARLGREPEAVAQYKEAVRLRPDFADAYNNFGLLLKTQGKLAEAVAQYEQALRIKPHYAEARRNLGMALARLGRMAEAVEQWEQALGIGPDDSETEYDLGVALDQLGRKDEALAHYERAVRLNPDFAEAHNNLGLALAQLGRMSEAAREWQEVLRITPDNAEAHINLGNALVGLGRAAEAIGHYKKALEIDPKNAGARSNLDALAFRLRE
jgi:tetratricopeptide (TPR) repeat protein